MCTAAERSTRLSSLDSDRSTFVHNDDNFWAHAATLESLTLPELDFTGYGPPPGQLCAVGSDDGFKKVVAVVVLNPMRREAIVEQYRLKGWIAISAPSRSTFAQMIPPGLWPSIIVTDQLDFIAQVRALEPSHVPPVPIYAVIDGEQPTEAYMHGATGTISGALVEVRALELDS